MTTTRRLLLGCAFVLLLAAPAPAQVSTGLRVGASSDPDQFYFGGHVETRPLAENLRFRPNVEIGVGHDVTTLAFNFELAYKFAVRQAWRPYILGGPALIVYDTDRSTTSRGGFNVGVGLEHRGGLFGEVKIGAIDSPEFKIAIGFRL